MFSFTGKHDYINGYSVPAMAGCDHRMTKYLHKYYINYFVHDCNGGVCDIIIKCADSKMIAATLIEYINLCVSKKSLPHP